MSELRAVRKVVLATAVVVSLLAGGRAEASPSTRDAVAEQKLEGELQALAPDAVPLFQQGTKALDARDLPTAVREFSKVLEKAPLFSPAERRRCGALENLGQHAEAVRGCRAAVLEQDLPFNEAALAMVLASKTQTDKPTPDDAKEARERIQRATTADPNDPYLWQVTMQIAFGLDDLYMAEHAIDRLQVLAPHDPLTSFGGAVLAGRMGNVDRLRERLKQARVDGIPAAMADSLEADVNKAEVAARPWWLVAAKWLGCATALWVSALTLLLLAGYVLSRVTLQAIASHPVEAHVRPSERRLRKAYGAVLWCASAFYYVSMPLVALVVVAALGGAIWAVLAMGYIAPKLFLVLGLLGFGTLSAIARSLFVKATHEDPGLRLDLQANPQLRAVLDEVAARIGTRPVDRVFVTPFTDVAVFDRGSLGAQLRGGSERCLILGAGVLDGMRLRAFKSVLAHEYGHFHNEDTAGGGFALAVRRSLSTMTIQLIQRRAASWMNPAWWFVRGFWRAFLGISQGASRLQEVLADRWAAFAYGSASFEEGLRHVIERTVRFGAHVDATVTEVVKSRAALPNLYAFVPVEAVKPEKVDREIALAFGKEPTPFDSHPCPEDRLAKVRALAFEGGAPGATDDAEVWSLFADRVWLEGQMTAEVRQRIRSRSGVILPAG